MKNKKRLILSLLCLLWMLAFVPMQAMAATKVKVSIKLNTRKISLEVGKTTTLTATVTGKSQKVIWKSSNKKVATVSGGVVTTKKAGKVTITAKANGKTAKCVVTVKQPDYKSIYKKLLEQSRVSAGDYNIVPGYYYVLNIDKKGVPELIVTSKETGGPAFMYHVFTIKNGKAVYAGYCSVKGMTSKPYVKYSARYKGIYEYFAANMYGSGHALYGMSNYKLIRKQHQESYVYPKVKYVTGTTNKQLKTVTAAKYQNFYKKYFNSLKKYNLLSNNAANRKKSFG